MLFGVAGRPDRKRFFMPMRNRILFRQEHSPGGLGLSRDGALLAVSEKRRGRTVVDCWGSLMIGLRSRTREAVNAELCPISKRSAGASPIQPPFRHRRRGGAAASL